MKRRRSLTTVLVYWFAILAGLALFTTLRRHDIDVAGMWIGVIGGSALGQFLALRAIRLWFVGVLLLAFVILCGPFTPSAQNGLLFWMAMIPGTLCGWMSLSERGSLVAFWFPSVIWMLSILDRGKGALRIDSGSAALLGGLAFMFVAFLYARETRRIDLWRTVSPTPIAPEAQPVILREVPRLRINMAGWSIVVSGIAFAVCAWLAPRLWHVEALVPDLHASAIDTPAAPSHICCHDLYMMREQKRARVSEYFDIGRGHDAEVEDDFEEKRIADSCVVCGPDNQPLEVSHYGGVDGWYIGQPCYRPDGTSAYRDGAGICVPCYGYINGIGDCVIAGYSGGYSGGGGYVAGGDGTGAGGGAYAPGADGYTPPSAPSYTPATPNTYEPQPQYTPPTPPAYEPPAPPPAYEPPTPPPAYQPPPPAYEPPPPLEPQRVDPPSAPPQIAAAPETAPTPTTTPPPLSTNRPATTTTATPPTAGAQQASAPPDGPPIVYWVLVVLAGGLAFQVLALGLRPVRRILTLRHLRKPFWTETVDQRISNWWHLALVGLRDAGWRTTSGEAPRELAKRLDIDGVDRAADILERARHGVGIDAADLSEMGEACEQAYRASRARTSMFARAIGWFRRPLV